MEKGHIASNAKNKLVALLTSAMVLGSLALSACSQELAADEISSAKFIEQNAQNDKEHVYGLACAEILEMAGVFDSKSGEQTIERDDDSVEFIKQFDSGYADVKIGLSLSDEYNFSCSVSRESESKSTRSMTIMANLPQLSKKQLALIDNPQMAFGQFMSSVDNVDNLKMSIHSDGDTLAQKGEPIDIVFDSEAESIFEIKNPNTDSYESISWYSATEQLAESNKELFD